MSFTLNLLRWSCLNAVAEALESSIYIWKADIGAVIQLEGCSEGSYISIVSTSPLTVPSHILTSGCGDGRHHDARIPIHEVMGHFCGITWRNDGAFLRQRCTYGMVGLVMSGKV